MSTFDSAHQSIACALKTAEVAAATGLQFHQGIHIGDVINEEDNVYGGVVNIAARIASVTAPGEILVSDTVRSIARSSTRARFIDVGDRQLKGIDEAIRLFRVLSPGTDNEPATTTPGQGAPHLITRIREIKRVGGERDPAVYAVVVVENPNETNAFLDSFDVEMLDPFAAGAVRVEYRSSPSTPIYQLAMNIPAHGISQAVVVIAHFDQPLAYDQPCKGRMAAIGPVDYALKWQDYGRPPVA
jgi:hypothetical protein